MRFPGRRALALAKKWSWRYPSVMDKELLDRLVETEIDLSSLTPEQALAKQWELLSMGLQLEENLRPSLAKLVATLNNFPLFNEFQLWSALKAVNCHLTGLLYTPPTVIQGASGAAPLITADLLPWALTPLQPFHPQLGLAWAILGHLTGCDTYLAAAERIASWQLNLLDERGEPAPALFTQEGDPSPLLPLGVLFEATGRRYLTSESLGEPWEAIRTWAAERVPHLTDLQLARTICDPHSALVGVRSQHHSAWATVKGGATGLGSFVHKDVALLAYGPQHFPLEDCRGFGIETVDSEQPTLQSDNAHFLLHGLTRLTALPDDEGFRQGTPSSVWLQVRQELTPQSLAIDVRFHSLVPLDKIAFSFYVKGVQCRLDDGTFIEADSLQGFEGPVQAVEIIGQTKKLHLSSLPGRGKMRLVPLPGGDRFWGANFLIATLLDPSCSDYHWRATMPSG